MLSVVMLNVVLLRVMVLFIVIENEGASEKGIVI